MIRAAIIGATGYTGSELVRILHSHEDVEIVMITSESREGEGFSEVHPQFRGICDQKLASIQDLNVEDIDVAFLALPHGVSMDFVREHSSSDLRIIDLSGDFRISTAETYETWYKMKHRFPEGIQSAVFGLPEFFRDEIKDAKLVANPGCYPTASILALGPLLKERMVDVSHLVVDAKSGLTGAGIKAKTNTHFSNVNENFKAYGIGNHRHTIEIQEVLSNLGDQEVNLLFTPHLLPVDRGILATAYVKPKNRINQNDLDKVYMDYYSHEPFLRYSKTHVPEIKAVRGSNGCDVYAKYDKRTNTIITIGVIDNLVKGASGQAVQNMNVMFGLTETKGLKHLSLQP